MAAWTQRPPGTRSRSTATSAPRCWLRSRRWWHSSRAPTPCSPARWIGRHSTACWPRSRRSASTSSRSASSHRTTDHQNLVTAAHRDGRKLRAHPTLQREGAAPMTSAPVRDPLSDHLITPENAAFLLIDYQPSQLAGVHSMDRDLLLKNAVSTVRTIKTFGVPVVHSTINVATGRGQPTLPELAGLLADDKPLDRTTTNSWEDIEFVQAVHATGRRKLIICALWTEICMAFTALDALREGYEVYPVVDAIGGTSPEAHHAGLDRVMQAGGQPISWVALAVELQRDWARQDTVAAVIEIVLTDRLLKEQERPR